MTNQANAARPETTAPMTYEGTRNEIVKAIADEMSAIRAEAPIDWETFDLLNGAMSALSHVADPMSGPHTPGTAFYFDAHIVGEQDFPEATGVIMLQLGGTWKVALY